MKEPYELTRVINAAEELQAIMEARSAVGLTYHDDAADLAYAEGVADALLWARGDVPASVFADHSADMQAFTDAAQSE